MYEAQYTYHHAIDIIGYCCNERSTPCVSPFCLFSERPLADTRRPAPVKIKRPRGDWTCPVCRRRDAHAAREAKARAKREEKKRQLEASKANKGPAKTVSLLVFRFVVAQGQ